MLGTAIANLDGVISVGQCCDLGNISRTRLSGKRLLGPTLANAHILNLVLCDVTTANHASISLFGLAQKVGVFFRESYLQMDMWKEQMNQRHGHDI